MITLQGKAPLLAGVGSGNNSDGKLLKTFQPANMQVAQKVINRTLPPNLSVGRKLLKTFQPANMQSAQKVIRTNLSSYSAKLLAQQSANFLANQSGEYFPNLKGGEFTPFAKGDFSHLSKVGKSCYLNSFISKNGKIEFSDSIKKDSGRAALIQVQYFQSSAGGWGLMSVRNTYAVTLSNHVNDVHSVDCLGLRCLRLISPCRAVTMNCPVLSPSSFNSSTLFAISCGTRASSFFDFAFVALVAMSDPFSVWWLTVYTKINDKKLLTWLTLNINLVADTLKVKLIQKQHTEALGAYTKKQRLEVLGTLPRRLITTERK